MLYLVQRTDCDRFQLAEDIDPEYASAYRKATAAGVETLVFATKINQHGVTLGQPLPMG